MKLQGINEINDILNRFLEPFDCTADIGEDFCYWDAHNLINYALVVSTNSDIWFQEFAHALMPDLKCDTFLLSLMHELGHHETLDEIDDDTYDYCRRVKDEINATNSQNTKENNFKYFNLPDEIIATEWGLNYMMQHKEEMIILWNELQPAILNFYKVNDIH
jgi:hypothetical protein